MAETLAYPDLKEDAEAERDWIRKAREGDSDSYPPFKWNATNLRCIAL